MKLAKTERPLNNWSALRAPGAVRLRGIRLRSPASAALALLVPGLAVAALEIPHSFSEGSVVSAEEMNENFEALATEVNALALQVEQLSARPTPKLGQTRLVESIPVGTSPQFEALGDGFLNTRPGGPGDIGSIWTSVRLCTTVGETNCNIGPRARFHGQPLTFPVRAGEFVLIDVNGGLEGDSVSIYWTPLTEEATSLPVRVAN